MKRLLFLTVAAVAMIVGAARAETAETSAKAPKVDLTHPRIILRKGQEKSLMSKVKKDDLWLNVHNNLIKECDRICTLPLGNFLFDVNGKTILWSAREIFRRITVLSYGYRMTYDYRYLRRAEAEMLNVAAREDWNPKTFLDVSELTSGMAIGYDWLYQWLPITSREKISKAIIEKGLKPSLEEKYNRGWIKSVNNWNQVCNAAMTLGAIATYDIDTELARTIIDRAEKALVLPMSNYAPDGAYPEGPVYWEYGTSFNALYLSAYENFFGRESARINDPGFMKTGEYIAFMTSPTQGSFNYSDCRYGSEVDLSPAVMWFYSKTKNPVLIYDQKPVLEDKKRNFSKDRLSPLSVVWGAGSGMSVSKAKAPEKLLYVAGGTNGVATMRSAWDNPNAVFVGLKAGSPSNGHGHMDVGSFVLEADGLRWGADLGGEAYNTIETHLKGAMWRMTQDSPRWDIFRYSNWAHSTLTIDSARQVMAGRVFIDRWSDGNGGKEVMFIESDLTPVYKGQVEKVVRHIEMRYLAKDFVYYSENDHDLLNRRYVMVVDEITTGDKAVTVRWNMTTPAEKVVPGENGLALFQRGKRLDILVSANPAESIDTDKLLHTWGLDPAYRGTIPYTVKTWSANPKNYNPAKWYENPNDGFSMAGYEIRLEPNTKTRLTVLLMPSNDQSVRLIPPK